MTPSQHAHVIRFSFLYKHSVTFLIGVTFYKREPSCAMDCATCITVHTTVWFGIHLQHKWIAPTPTPNLFGWIPFPLLKLTQCLIGIKGLNTRWSRVFGPVWVFRRVCWDIVSVTVLNNRKQAAELDVKANVRIKTLQQEVAVMHQSVVNAKLEASGVHKPAGEV